MVHLALGIAGTLIVLATWWSLLRTLVVPRGSSQMILAKNRLLMAGFRFLAHRTRTYRGRDAILIWGSPMGIFTSLLLWLLLFFLGYGLLLFSTSDLGLSSAFREAGSSLFTLGFAGTDRGSLTTLDFVAAATGPITIGLLIGYLPTMYSAYQDREAEVTLLQGRAGEPSWGPELLRRHALVGMSSQLYDLWPAWERWAAEVSESHTNFPVLIQMRSARPNRNWLVALLCVMDAAAMHLALNPDQPQDRPRLLLRQGIVCMQELALVERVPFDPDPSPDTPSDVTLEQFVSACEGLAAFDYPMTRTPAEAYPHFAGWRANYEAMAYEMAARIEAVPAPWSGPRRPPLPVIMPTLLVNRLPGGGTSRPGA